MARTAPGILVLGDPAVRLGGVLAFELGTPLFDKRQRHAVGQAEGDVLGDVGSVEVGMVAAGVPSEVCGMEWA